MDSETISGIHERISRVETAKSIYLIATLDSLFQDDFNCARRIAEIHRRNPVDAVFIPDVSHFPVVEKYCRENETRMIDFIATNAHCPMDEFLSGLSYSMHNPQKDRFIQVSPAENLERLKELYKMRNFTIL